MEVLGRRPKAAPIGGTSDRTERRQKVYPDASSEKRRSRWAYATRDEGSEHAHTPQPVMGGLLRSGWTGVRVVVLWLWRVACAVLVGPPSVVEL